MRFLFRIAGNVVLGLICLSAGLAAGVWLAVGGMLGGVGDVLAATTGAAIGVFGAIWAAGNREAVQRENLIHVLFGSIQKIAVAASEVIARPDRKPSAEMDDVHLAVHGVVNRWQHLANFSPYHELGNWLAVDRVADVDAACRHLASMLEDNLSQSPIADPHSSSYLVASTSTARRRGRAFHSARSLHDAAVVLMTACGEANEMLARMQKSLRVVRKKR